MTPIPLLALSPYQPLVHLEYSSIKAANAIQSKQEDDELAGRRDLLSRIVLTVLTEFLFSPRQELLESLSQLYDALACSLSYQLDLLHATQLISFNESCSNIQTHEKEQGLLLFFFISHSFLHWKTLNSLLNTSLSSLRGISDWLALVKANLRTFLANISAAFNTFLGFSSAPASTPASSNPLLAIAIPEDVTPIDRDGLVKDLEDNQAEETSKLNGLFASSFLPDQLYSPYIAIGILQELYSLFDDLAAFVVEHKLEFDSIVRERVDDFEKMHRAEEEKNGELFPRHSNARRSTNSHDSE